MNIERRGISVACRVDTSRLATKILWFCLLCEIAFVILDYHVNYGRWTEIGAMRRMFNTAREDGLASWFAVTQTPLVSLTLWFIYALAKRGHQPRLKVVGWLVLALFFTYMAFDDGVQMHERLGSTFNTVRERSGGSLDFFPSYTWQILFLPGFALLGGFTLCFLWLELHDGALRGALVLAILLLVFAVAWTSSKGWTTTTLGMPIRGSASGSSSKRGRERASGVPISTRSNIFRSPLRRPWKWWRIPSCGFSSCVTYRRSRAISMFGSTAASETRRTS